MTRRQNKTKLTSSPPLPVNCPHFRFHLKELLQCLIRQCCSFIYLNLPTKVIPWIYYEPMNLLLSWIYYEFIKKEEFYKGRLSSNRPDPGPPVRDLLFGWPEPDKSKGWNEYTTMKVLTWREVDEQHWRRTVLLHKDTCTPRSHHGGPRLLSFFNMT